MKYFVRSGALSGFPEFVREHGENPSALLRSAGLTTAVLHDPDMYISYVALGGLLTLAAKHCQAPAFGAQLGYRQGLEAVGALGSLMCLQATVPDALRMMQKNLDFHARGVSVDLEVQGDSIELQMNFAFTSEIDCDQITAISMALLMRGLSQLHQQPLPPSEVHLTIPAPKKTGAYTTIFGSNIVFSAAQNRMRYPSELLALPVDPKPELRLRLSQQWRGNWEQRQPVSLLQQVERAITALLPTGECSLETVARIVEVHPRSLQSLLKEQSNSFGRLLQVIRLRLACQYLENSDIDLTTLALNLGFAELAVFSRAFKKWTGKPPRVWRQQVQGVSA